MTGIGDRPGADRLDGGHGHFLPVVRRSRAHPLVDTGNVSPIDAPPVTRRPVLSAI